MKKWREPLLSVSFELNLGYRPEMMIYADSDVEQLILEFVKIHNLKPTAIDIIRTVIETNLKEVTLENSNKTSKATPDGSNTIKHKNSLAKKNENQQQQQYKGRENQQPLQMQRTNSNNNNNTNNNSKSAVNISQKRTASQSKTLNTNLHKQSSSNKENNGVQRSKQKNGQPDNKMNEQSATPFTIDIVVPEIEDSAKKLTCEVNMRNRSATGRPPVHPQKNNEKLYDTTDRTPNFGMEELQRQFEQQFKWIRTDRLIKNNEQELKELYKQLTRLNPPQYIDNIHPDFIDFSGFSQFMLNALQEFFEKLEEDDFVGLNFPKFIELLHKYDSYELVRRLSECL